MADVNVNIIMPDLTQNVNSEIYPVSRNINMPDVNVIIIMEE